jgi:hypothetical protein
MSPIHHSGHEQVPHPDAVFVVGADPKHRHYRGYTHTVTGEISVLCFWWEGREMSPSDGMYDLPGVYDLPVCGRCAQIRRG